MEISYNAYLWLKFWHIIGFTSWMAMLFYLPRLFVYHAENSANSGFCDVVKIQERKLYHGIGWIAMLGTVGTGLAILLSKPELMRAGYFHMKLTCALVLIAYHFSLWYFIRRFRDGRCEVSGRFFRFYNEIPTIVILIIVYAMIIQAYK